MGVAAVPVQDVKLAIDEAKRAVNELGFKGVFVRPNPIKGRNIDDPYYDPLYKTVIDLGVPLLIHEGSGAFLPTAGADRFVGQWFFTHTISHPLEQMLASLGLDLQAAPWSGIPNCSACFSNPAPAGCPIGSGAWTSTTKCCRSKCPG